MGLRNIRRGGARRGAGARRSPRRAPLAPDRLGDRVRGRAGALLLAQRPRARTDERAAPRSPADHAGPGGGVHDDVHAGQLCRAGADAARAALPALRVRDPGVRPAGAQGRHPAGRARAGAVRGRRGVRVLRGAAGRADVPAELQRRQLPDGDPRTRLLLVRVDDDGLRGHPVPGAGGSAGPDAARHRDTAAAAERTAATPTWRARCSPRCFPASTPCRCSSRPLRWCCSTRAASSWPPSSARPRIAASPSRLRHRAAERAVPLGGRVQADRTSA